MTKLEKFDQYKNLVHGAIHHYFGNEIEIEQKYKSFGIVYNDLAQIGFMHLWESLDKIDDDNCPSSYIYNGVFMVINNYFKRKGSLIKMPEDQKYECVWSSYDNTTEHDTELGSFLTDHCDNYAQVVNKVFFEQIASYLKNDDVKLLKYRLKGMTQQQISDHIGISRQGVQVREQRIFKQIRKMVG